MDEPKHKTSQLFNDLCEILRPPNQTPPTHPTPESGSERPCAKCKKSNWAEWTIEQSDLIFGGSYRSRKCLTEGCGNSNSKGRIRDADFLKSVNKLKNKLEKR